jgi:hypothetical protein
MSQVEKRAEKQSKSVLKTLARPTIRRGASRGWHGSGKLN